MATKPRSSQQHDATLAIRETFRSASIPQSSLASAGALLTLLSMVVIADALFRQPGMLEYAAINAIQSIADPITIGMARALAGAASLTILVVIWATLLLVSGVTRRWGAFVATTAVPIVALSGVVVRRVVAHRDVPDPSAALRSIDVAAVPGLAGGQVIAAILVYGLLYFFARSISSPAWSHPWRRSAPGSGRFAGAWCRCTTMYSSMSRDRTFSAMR
jgi:hypothetical protein